MPGEDQRKLLRSIEDWRKLLPYAPIAAVVVVIVAALGMDLAFGGPSKPEIDNAAAPPEVARATIAAAPVSPTPFVPPATETPTAAPTEETGPTAQIRDQRRVSDLADIAAALEQYREKEGEYPTTGGNIQTVCTYKDIDAGCKLEDFLGNIPVDPEGDSVKNGYWYSSDGKTFTLVAAVDLAASATPAACEERFAQHTKKAHLYCLTGP
ncbi:MAG TPA: hypothetical protein VM013_01420 [Dehalococcoidia bacterium]|nr:hypothetical protein [Dehalococcoidia bacterium]